MKRSFYLVAIVMMIMALNLSSCSKYEDGPLISLRTRKARVVNTWKIDRVFENGNDVTAYVAGMFPQYAIYLRDDDTYTISWSSVISENGTWRFEYNQEGIITIPDAGTDPTSWTILRLKNDELWLETIDLSSNVWEYQFVTR